MSITLFNPYKGFIIMMKQTSRALWLSAMLISILSGCASSAKVFIPNEIKTVPEGYARVVITRVKQLSGTTTPIYIMDIGNELESNGRIAVRVGKWVKEPGLSLWYIPGMLNSFSPGGFMILPTGKTSFAESDLSLDDLFNKNLNAVIYVDYLSCNPEQLSTLSCGNGDRECLSDFTQELTRNNGIILGSLEASKNKQRARKVQVVGKIGSGDTLIWDRKPGLMRIGALWGAFIKSENIVEITPGNIEVEAGKTYYLKYEISLGDHTNRGDRWTITRVE
jgi:uncharacterized protein YceK